MCKISVLMPVYNGEKYLGKAIESILNQTYRNFELLILLEYESNRMSKMIIRHYQKRDSRIRVYQNKKRLGLPESLNKGIRAATGEYIARMDADDISLPRRFEVQVKFLECHPQIMLCGTDTLVNGIQWMHYWTEQEQIQFQTFFSCPFAHPTVMWRRKGWMEAGLFYRNVSVAEDYELWMRAVETVSTANISQPLVIYRMTKENRTTVYFKEMQKKNENMRNAFLEKHGIISEFCEENGLEDSKQNLHEMERIVKEVCCLFEDKSRIYRPAERIMAVYYAEHQVKHAFKRYWKYFFDLYPKSMKVKGQAFLYFLYRIMRRNCLLFLIQIKGSLFDRGIQA